MKLNLDYETRSTCDLRQAGAYVYARHPSTRVLCAAYSINDGPVRIWPAAAGRRMPPDLRAAFDNPKCEVHAWNAQFERLITKHVVGIDVPLQRYRCTAAHARLRSLPGKLEGALNFLGMAPGLAAKREGAAIMLKWCKPLHDGTWASDPEEFVKLLNYCMDDVRSEAAIAAILAAAPMTRLEQTEYELNERVNDAGLPIDRELALAAQAYGAEERIELAGWMSELTGGVITSASQHTRIKEWLAEQLPPAMVEQYFRRDGKLTTDKSARADFLASDAIDLLADPTPVALMELVDDAGKASVAKYAKMAARAVDNGRAEGSYLLAGAGQTKRYSSQGIQMHNLPRKALPDTQAAITQVLEHRVPERVMHVLAGLLRPTIKAEAGKALVWGDWSSVEARGMPWLASNKRKLDLYRSGVDVYKRNAVDIFDVAEGDVTDHQRQVGKVAELSLQFGGAVGALRNMARNYGISFDNDTAETVVNAWRNANKWAARFSQGLLNAFAGSLLFQGELIYHEGVTYEALRMHGRTGLTVRCTLPGGTRLYYQDVRANIYVRQANRYTLQAPRRAALGERTSSAEILNRMLGAAEFRADNMALVMSLPPWLADVSTTYPTREALLQARMAAGLQGDSLPELSYSKALTTSGHRERIWHGLLAENVTQAICAALLRDCLGRVEQALVSARLRAAIVGHTHDEIIIEASTAHVKKASAILECEMLRVPEWLPGFPLGCEVKSGPRYVK